MILSLSSRSPFVSFHIPDIAMELRTKKRYNFKDVLRGKHPTKKQSQVREYIPRSTCVTFIIHLDKLKHKGRKPYREAKSLGFGDYFVVYGFYGLFLACRKKDKKILQSMGGTS